MASFRVFLDRLYLREVKPFEMLPAGESLYRLNSLKSSEVRKVLVFNQSWLEVPFRRVQGGIRLNEPAAGQVLVIPIKYLSAFETGFGAVRPVEIFFKQERGIIYSDFTIRSLVLPELTAGAWEFSETKLGVRVPNLTLATFPSSVWVFATNLSSIIDHATTIETTAQASLGEVNSVIPGL